MLFTLATLSGDDKTPGFYAENKFGQGASNGSEPWYCVVTGNKTSAGSVTADSYVGQVYSEDEIASKFGARSEIAQQAREALAAGAAVICAPVAEAAGAVAATLVLNCEALGSGSGQVSLLLGDETVSFVVDTASKQNTMTAAQAAVAAKPNLFCVATLGGATDYDVTLTVSSAGIRGNDWLAKLDMSQAPTGCIMTLGRDSDPNGIKTSIATVAAPVTYTAADFDGVLAPGADPATFAPPRQATATLAAVVGGYSNGTTITFTGTSSSGGALTEAVTITGTGGGITLRTIGYFATVTQIVIQAQPGVTGSFEFGAYSQAEASASGYVKFAGGTGTDDCSNVINLLEATEYRRIGAAQNDAVNAARWEAHADSESDPLIAHLEQVIFGHNGTSTEVISLAQTTLNAYLCGVYAQRRSRKHPCQIAAKVAAIRSVMESQNLSGPGTGPHTRYDGLFNDTGAALWTTVPAHALDMWTHAEIKALLNAGVSPINDFNGDTRIVRSICTHSLNGVDPDYRCLDTCEVSVPQYGRDRLAALAQEALEQNPGVGPDLPDGLPQIEGVNTPKIWNATVTTEWESIQSRGAIMNVSTNPPISEYNTTSERIDTIAPMVVRPHQHQIAASVRQIAA